MIKVINLLPRIKDINSRRIASLLTETDNAGTFLLVYLCLHKNIYFLSPFLDFKNAIVASLLPAFILPSMKIAKKEKKKFWRPTIIESREGFALHVLTISDLDRAISDRKAKFAELGIRLQPMVIIIGSKLTEIKEYFVWYDDITYKFHSFLATLDITFKLIFALNLNFNVESLQVWQFVQKKMYNITTKYDLKIQSAVNAFILDIDQISG